MRMSISGGQLAQFVADEVSARVETGGSFTAYDITRALRGEHPDLQIMHAPVRTLVHAYMANPVAAGRYEASHARFGTKAAVLYEPTRIVVLPNLPLLPMN